MNDFKSSNLLIFKKGKYKIYPRWVFHTGSDSIYFNKNSNYDSMGA